MKLKHLIWVVVAIVGVSQLASGTTAQGQDVKAAYDRAESLGRRTQGLAVNLPENPNWVENSTKVWYRKAVKGGNEFVLADAATKTKGPAFDHAKLAAALSTATSQKYTALELPFTTFTFVDNQRAIEFTVAPVGGGRAAAAVVVAVVVDAAGGAPGPTQPRYRCTITDYTCARATGTRPAEAQAGQGRGRRRRWRRRGDVRAVGRTRGRRFACRRTRSSRR